MKVSSGEQDNRGASAYVRVHLDKTDANLASIFRAENKSPKKSIPAYMWIVASVVVIGGALAFLAIAIMTISKNREEAAREAAEYTARYEAGRAEAERYFKESGIDDGIEEVDRAIAEAKAMQEMADIIVGATVKDWREASDAAKLLIAESWVKTAFPTASASHGPAVIKLAAAKLTLCINTAIRDMPEIDQTPAAEIGSACIQTMSR